MIHVLLTRPIVSGLALLLATLLFAGLSLPSLQFEGDVARALKGASPAFHAYSDLEENFAAPSKDEVLYVRANDFGQPETFQALEDLVLGLQLTDGVAGVISVFTLPDPQGTGLSYLSRGDVADLPPAMRLDTLHDASPLAPYIVSESRNATLVTILPDLSVPAAQRLAALDAEIALATPDLDIAHVSMAALQREISEGLLADQLFVVPVATILCIGIALLLFRSWRAAVICAIPSLFAITWTLATMAVLGIPFDTFMSIVPPLILVLGIADSVHVFHAVLHHAKTDKPPDALARGLTDTMPAVVLAALTTALAFSCLFFTGSPTLANVAVVGPIAMVFTTLFVYLALPPAIVLIFGKTLHARARPLGFHGLTSAAVRALRWYRGITFATFVLLGALIFAVAHTTIGYRLMDHIPRDGAFRAALADLRQDLPGSDQSFAILQAADPEPGVSEADRALLERAGQALYGLGDGLIPIRDGPDVESAILDRFEAGDGRAFALPLIQPLDQTSDEILNRASKASEDLNAAGVSDHVLTGYSLMTSIELPIVVTELRFAFYVAVGLVTVLAGLLLQSVWLAVLSIVPNLIPIFSVEAGLVVADRPMTIIGAIALTIAFGIAVDDTVHLLNRLRLAKSSRGRLDRSAVETAVRMTAAPIMTTSLVLIMGFTVTAFSILPSVSVLGQLLAAAIAIAVIADLFLFPSLLYWGAKGDRR